MTWQFSVLQWLVHAALGGFVFLALGCVAVRFCRQPVRRLRLIELTLLGCLLVPWVNQLPGMPQWFLGWIDLGSPPPAAVSSTSTSESVTEGFAVSLPQSPLQTTVLNPQKNETVAPAPASSIALAPLPESSHGFECRCFRSCAKQLMVHDECSVDDLRVHSRRVIYLVAYRHRAVAPPVLEYATRAGYGSQFVLRHRRPEGPPGAVADERSHRVAVDV